MKTKLLLIVSILCLLAVFVQPVIGQDINKFPTVRYYSDSLKATVGVPSRDTVDVNFDMALVKEVDYFTISAYSTAADTVKIYSRDAAGNFVQRSVNPLTTGTSATTMITNTTRNEWVIQDGEPYTIRLVCNDYSCLVYFTVAIRRAY